MLIGYITQTFWLSTHIVLRKYEASASTFRTCL